MDFDNYQIEARKTAIYPNKDKNFIYPTLGLVGESEKLLRKLKRSWETIMEILIMNRD